MVADIGSARSYAIPTIVVVAVTRVAVALRIVLMNVLVSGVVFGVTPENLSVTHTHTHTNTHGDERCDFIICPMLCYSNGTDNNNILPYD